MKLLWSMLLMTPLNWIIIWWRLTSHPWFLKNEDMGMGIYAGKKRNLNAEISINHYSNGNIFTENEDVKIPLTFTLGYAF